MTEKYSNRAILFVDDDPMVLSSLRRGLYKEPYKKFFANSGHEAIEIMEKQAIHVLVTDMRMPEMDGLQLIKYVKLHYPDIIRIVLSGFADVSTVLCVVNQGDIFNYISKPWKMEQEFKVVIRRALDYYNLNTEKDLYYKILKDADVDPKFLSDLLGGVFHVRSNSQHDVMRFSQQFFQEFVICLASFADVEHTCIEQCLQNNNEGCPIASVNASFRRFIEHSLDYLDLFQDDFSLNIRQCQLASCFDMLFEEFHEKAQANNHQLIVENKLSGVAASFDLDRLETILRELFENALSFTRNGSIKIQLKSLTRKDELWLEIEMRDSGLGIRDQDLPLITQPFYQKNNVQGSFRSGLGLSIVARIIELFHGELSITSEWNFGTQVKILFPVQ